jgi:hypothetical protein
MFDGCFADLDGWLFQIKVPLTAKDTENIGAYISWQYLYHEVNAQVTNDALCKFTYPIRS